MTPLNLRVDAEGLGAEAGHEGVPGGGTDGLVAIGGFEKEATFGEAVDVGGVDERVAVAGDDGFEVVNADEKDVGFFGGAGLTEKNENERKDGDEFHGDDDLIARNLLRRGNFVYRGKECKRIGI